MKVTDLDAWRRVCMKAFDNLPTNTMVRMADVDAVLQAGARDVARIDLSTEAGSVAYEVVLLSVWEKTGVDRGDIDAILTWCGSDAAGLIEE